MLNFIENIVKIPSYTGNFRAVEECFVLCKDYCDNCFMKEVEVNGYRSVLFSNVDTLNFDILSVCHIDVVPSKVYDMSVNDNIVRGRGVFDMKSFVVVALYNLKRIKNFNIANKYGVLVVSDEESGGENGTKYWIENLNLKTKIVLDSDSCIGNINNILKDNLGAITIKLYGDMFDKMITIQNIKKRFGNFYINVVGDEIDLNFDEIEIKKTLKKCMYNTKYEILMLNEYIKNDINDKHHRLYKQICEDSLEHDIVYITGKTTNDSRYFSYKNINVIGHQSNGGDYHKDTEWLDFSSLLKFCDIQFKFISTKA
jgi:acetylornithine deacetylase/succinyl-diaminopimelate desuccinylase-like protein